MSGVDLMIAALGLCLAGVLKGATGIGYATCALPFLAATVGLDRAMALVIAPAIASNLALLLVSGGPGRALRRFWRFYVAIVPGIAAGATLLTGIDPGLAVYVLGLLTLAYVVLSALRPDISIGATLERRLAAPAGFANGVLTGMTGSQVLPLMPYMMALRLPANDQVQAVNLAVMIASTVLGAAILVAGLVTPALLLLSAAGILPAIVGVAAGTRVRGMLAASQFRALSLTVLAALGIGLIVQAARLHGSCPRDTSLAVGTGSVCKPTDRLAQSS